MNGKKNQGFTLVELAIALMVIGLLLGGVLKGQELIENARVTATLRDVTGYDTAVMIFRNTYNALPGDIKKPNRIPNCTTELCNRPGNGDGEVNHRGDNDTTETIELYNIFTHMTKAGMLKGPEGGTEADMNTVEGEEWFDLTDNKEKFFPMTATGLISADSQSSRHHTWLLRTTGFYFTRLADKLGMSIETGVQVEDCPAADHLFDPEGVPDSGLSDDCGVFIELN